MGEKLSSLAGAMVGSEIVRLGNEINDRIRNGEKIYNYTIGDFDPEIFPLPKELENLIIQAYQKHYTNYPPGDGVAVLKKSVALFFKSNEGLDYDTSEILIASGGRPLIFTLFQTLVDEGDKVIYAVPSWNNNHYTNLNKGAHCVINTTPENNFMPLASDIEANVKHTVLICLCTPQNPTGTTLQKSELEKICAVIVNENKRRGETEKKVFLMFDQMYHMLTYGATKHNNPVSINSEMKKYTIFIDGISKAFAATGVRVGWAAGPVYIINKMKAFLSHIGAWAPMAEQNALAIYLRREENIKRYLISFRSALEERLQKIYEGFIALKNKNYNVDAITPKAAIYLTVKIDLAGKSFGETKLATQADVTNYILSEAKLAIVPFYAFGAGKQSPWYRLSVGTCKIEELSEMFSKLENALQKLCD